ncbi:MAG: hypothetical protein OEQ39_02870 [Gammaproteobacteria bacterium]|nr:hypothetical protein [Gammaproteobacteria bacterium]
MKKNKYAFYTKQLGRAQVLSMSKYYYLLGSKHHTIIQMADGPMFQSDLKRQRGVKSTYWSPS